MQRLRLVRPELLDAAGAQRVRDLRVQLVRQRDRARLPPVLRRLHDEPLVLAPGREQLVPRLDVTHDGHRCETRRVLRCAYVDLDRALLGRDGSFLHDADGRFSVLGARALEACERAGAEVVMHGDRDDVGAIAELLGLRAWIAGTTLVLDGEELDAADLAEAIARHLRARACEPEDALSVGADLTPATVVGTHWLVGARPEDDPLLGLELDRAPNVRLVESAGGGPALYEAVVTTLAEQRG